ncbi:hypothetical protein [Candidatus Uabimicrobium amorphum]|uniref:Uncharacterized protein n=1 Tax=Uabimicrobium amorphum TaxID=2596890 RepID=A0A5S9IQV4_UABAM|nr:hypothetical protein [Candidatus Uabimicrobium amorphum]BBM86399.1 hypothetical protein UABAM_04785 [Candidatus Uabimicrobium amorphum]
METFMTQKMSDVTVCFVANNSEVKAQEVEYCISSGFVRISTSDEVQITHISNVVLKTKA